MEPMTDREAIANFLLAGRAVCTLRSQSTGHHYTYKVTLADKRDEASPWDNWFVANLTGANEDYTYIGMLGRNGTGRPFFKTTAKTQNPEGANVKGFDWFVRQLFGGDSIEQVEFFHEGRCGRCC